MTPFSELLKRHRMAAGLSQESLAERARMSASAVGALERGVRLAPYRETVTLLARALQLSDAEHTALDVAAERARVRKGGPIPASPVVHNLPERLTSFVGRDDEMAEIEALLDQYRLVTITGSGGVGKTRAVLEIARRLAATRYGEVCFVDLAPISDESFVAGAVGALLGTSSGQDADAVQSLAARLKARELLLILDNCEHVIGAVAALAIAILRNCPGIVILATSRERLAIAGESVYRLPSLQVPAAQRLFVDRTLAVESRFVFSAERLETVASICRQLEGIPLAIEIAATRLPSLGFDALARRLREHFVLASGARDLPHRQTTMLATIEWSFDLLSEPERMLLRRIAIFRGGASLEAIEEVCAGDAFPASSVAELLSRLVDKSLVSMTAPDRKGRYLMFESVRAFAWNKLMEAGEFETTARAHAVWLATLSDRADEIKFTISSNDWFAQFLPELDNARGALEWSLAAVSDDDALLGLKIVGGLRGLWLMGRRMEFRRWLRAGMQRLDEERYPAVAGRLMRAHIQSLEGAEVFPEAERAAALFERIGDRRASISLRGHVAWQYAELGQTVEADNAIAGALLLADDEGIQFTRQYVDLLGIRNQIFERSDRMADARAGWAEQKKLADALGEGDPARTMSWESRFAFADGDHVRSAELLEGAIALVAGRTDFHDACDLHCDLALVRIHLGELDAAAVAARTALEQGRSAEYRLIWRALQHLATVSALRGEPRIAARLGGFVDALCERLGAHRGTLIREGFAMLTASVASQLDEETIARLAADGAALELDEAIDEALSHVL